MFWDIIKNAAASAASFCPICIGSSLFKKVCLPMADPWSSQLLCRQAAPLSFFSFPCCQPVAVSKQWENWKRKTVGGIFKAQFHTISHTISTITMCHFEDLLSIFRLVTKFTQFSLKHGRTGFRNGFTVSKTLGVAVCTGATHTKHLLWLFIL